MKLLIAAAMAILIVISAMILIDPQDVPSADAIHRPSIGLSPAKTAAEKQTAQLPSIVAGASNVTYEHQKPVTELDAQTLEYLSSITSDVLSDVAAKMRTSKRYGDTPLPGQVIPSRVVARLDSQGVLTIELGRNFIPHNSSPDELNEQLLWFEKTSVEFLATEVRVEEVQILFNGKPLGFYFPNDPGLSPG
jgi:hypothetical protein